MTNSNPTSKNNSADLPEQLRIRREKRERILDSGLDAYPVEVDRTISISDLRSQFVVITEDLQEREEGVTYLEVGEETDVEVAIAGRVMFVRNTGKLCFASIQEGNGTTVQAMLSLAAVGEESLKAWKADVDMGDIVSVRGKVISSKRGELSVMADSWHMASKSLAPTASRIRGPQRRHPRPPPLHRPHHARTSPHQRAHPHQGHACTPPLPRRPRLP